MTEIGFHFNAPDKVHYAARLIRKAALVRGLPVVVVGEANVLDSVDAALWDISPIDFVPHCRADAAPSTVALSSVLFAETAASVDRPHAVLINVGAALPAGFERFERLVDVVSADPHDRQQGRLRWRHYAERGYAIKPHDFAGDASE